MVENVLIVKLTDLPVSQKMQDVLKRLEDKQKVSMDEINDTFEIKKARDNMDISGSSIQLDNRLEIQANAFNQMNNFGSVRIDEIGKVVYSGEVERDSRLDIVIGLPASGKSSAIVNVLSEEFNSKVIDNDEAKKMIPEYNDGWGAGFVHEESQLISDAVFRKAIDNHENIVLPKVGSNADSLTKNFIQLAKKEGYKVNLHFVDLSREQALGRMLKRFLETGRFLDPNLIDKYFNERDGNKIEQTYEQLKVNSNLIDGYSRWNNDVKIGEKPILIESNNLDGNFIKNARIEREDYNYGRKKHGAERDTKDFTSDSGNSREGRRSEFQSPSGNSEHGCVEYDTRGTAGNNGQTLQINLRTFADRTDQITDGLKNVNFDKDSSVKGERISNENPLNKVEELIEGNYNQIDGVINNLPIKKEDVAKDKRKPEHKKTFSERICQAKEKTKNSEKTKNDSKERGVCSVSSLE